MLECSSSAIMVYIACGSINPVILIGCSHFIAAEGRVFLTIDKKNYFKAPVNRLTMIRYKSNGQSWLHRG